MLHYKFSGLGIAVAYARYFKRGKKRYGPFYYKSVRMPDGRIKSVYLGKTLPKRETIETERRFTSRNVIIITLLILMVIGVTSFTGYIILRPILVYHTETLNMTVNASQEYDWKPKNLGELNSIKLSGTMIGNGSVRVYMESQGKRYLILDRSLLEHKNSTLFGFVPFVRAENIVNTTQDIELNFVDICVDTCFLTDLNESSYKLVFEVENGTTLEIMEINYTIVEIESVEEKTEKLKELREKVIKLLPEKDNFKMNEKPRFRFTINESVEPGSLDMFVYGPDKKLSDMKVNVLKVGEGEFEIEVSKERAFRPGLYRMVIRNETYEEQTEFLWGVLAINTHKSIYLENEEAFIGIAVLDNQGHMVCDADVTLSITNPRGEVKKLRTSDGTIEISPECEVYGVTNLPDYYTYYSVSLAGIYTMNLTAITRNGVRTITDTFEVKKQVDFDVERNGSTRIYPPAKYKMIFTIKPKGDYEGPVIEYVPSSFDITPQNGLTITTAEDIKILTWNMKLTEGYTHEVEYEFDAPDVSPYLFVLGALEIGNWKETRQWMIASDAPVEVGYCRNLDTADTIYELNQSIDSNSSACLNVTANNVTIDGKGYTLTYAITDTGIGVNSNGYSQITIKNLIVTQTNTTRTNSPAIRIYSGQDNQIINNTIDVYGENSPDAYNYGIRFRNVTNTTIVNNTIITRTTCDYCHGIYLTTGSHNNTIEHNSITTIGDNSHGIYSTGSSQQTIYNNTIDMQDYYSRGIYLYNSSNNIINQTTITADQQADIMRIEQYSSDNIITNSNMTNLLSGGWGIRIETYSDDNNITNVNITAKWYAITLDNCQRTYIDNVYANGGDLSGIYVLTSNANDTRVNNSVMEMDRSTVSSLGAIHIRGHGWKVTNTNISTTGTYAAGIYLAGSNNFNGTNVTIKTTGSGNSEAIRISGSSTNNYLYDSTLSATNDNDVFFYSSGSGTLNLINTSIVDRSWSGSATHTLNVYWYMDAYVNYTNGSSMSDATVAAWDKDDNQSFSESTGSSGKIPRQTVQEYTQNNSGSNYYSNYTVNASKTDYYTNTTSVNLTTNKLLYFALNEIPPINITLNLDPNPANPNQNVSIYGHANQTDGNNVTNNIVNIYINDSIYYHNNNTGLLENTTAWWNTSWGYRKYIKTESSVSSDLDNSIIMINFSTTSLISEGKMRSDCGDVRFTDSNGNELEYTLETSTCNSLNTVFWVWANLTGNANTTIYPCHGYSATSLKTDYTNPDNDLKLYMHFDKSSEYGENDTFVYDFSRNGNNGTCSGSSCPTWDSNGRFAGAFDFDGSDDYFAVADTNDLNTGGPWTNRTTILWFNANNDTKRQVLYEEGAGTRGFNVYVDDGKVFVGGWNDDAGQSNWPGTFLNTTISVDTWYFVGFVLENGTDSAGPDKFKGYINGSEFDSGDGRKIYAHAADIGIGAMNDGAMFHNGTATGNGYYFNGSIDELRIYNRSLSADEILSIYNSTKDYYIANHSLPRTDGYGNYNYTFNASTTDSYEIKVNTTYYGKYAEANDTLIVQEGITQVGYCQELDSADTVYELNRSITSTSGNCFNITADGITLDGKGYSLGYATTDTGKAIYANGSKNITIRNLKINQTDTTRVNCYAIHVENSKYNNITNVTFNISGEDSPDGHDYAIYFVNTTNSSIARNNITTQSGCDYCHGVYLSTGSYNTTIEHNTITTNGGSYSSGILSDSSNDHTIYNNTINQDSNFIGGIRLYNSDNCVIDEATIDVSPSTWARAIDLEYYSDNNTINNTLITTIDNNAIYIYDNANDNNITNTNITASGASTGYRPLYVAISSHGTYMDNLIVECGYQCLYIGTGINNWEIHNSNLTQTGTSNELAYVQGDNWIINNTIMTTTGSTNGGGVEIRQDCNNAQILNSHIKTYGSGTSSEGILSICGDSMSIKDTIINSTNDDDVYLSQSSGILNFTNVTFVDKVWGTATITLNVHWYLDVYVNDTQGNDINSANITTYDKNKEKVFEVQTNSSGQIQRQEVLEYTQDNDDLNYKTPHTLNANKTEYYEKNKTVEIDGNKNVYITLTNTSLPYVEIISPENGRIYNNFTVLVNITNSSNTDSVWYVWNYTNYTYTQPVYHNFTTEGWHNITAYANNSNGTTNDYIEFMISLESVNVSDCQDLDSPNIIYQLNQSITSDYGTCFEVKADNVTLEGNGYTLTYASAGSGTAIYMEDYDNLTVRNLKMEQTSSVRANSLGIHIQNSKDNNITNNTFYIDGEDDPDAHSYGIRFVNTTNSIIIGNDITTQTTCDYCHGIYLTSNSHNNTIENNSIYTAGNYARGIYSHTSNNQTIYNNTIDVNDLSGNPVYLYQSNNCVINYTTIDSSGDARGIRLDLSDNNVIDNVDITTTSLNAIYFYDGSENNNITNTNITSTSYQTIHMSTGCHGSYIDNVTAQCSYRCLYTAANVNNWEVHNSNFTHTSSSNELAYLDGDNWLINNTIMTSTGSTNGEGVEIRTNCDNAQIIDSKIKTYGSGTSSDALNCFCFSPDSMSVKDTTIESVNDNDVYFNQGSATFNFTNVTFADKAWGGSATAVLNVHWYLDVYVNETDGSIIEGADVEGNDTNGDQWFSQQTQASGKIPQQTLLEYWEDNDETHYFTNYTINASKTGYNQNSTEVNLTTNKVVYLTLGQPPNISGETREPDPTYHSDNATLNATITDADGDLETVWISGNWSGSWVNYTSGITNVGDVYSYKLLSWNLSYQEVVGWRYYANDTSGSVGQGSLQVFTVQNHVPTNVTLEEPPNGTITADNTTFFDWSNATDDDGDSITYTLQVDNDTDFLSLEVEKTGLTNSDYTLTDPEALEEDIYYWRVYSNDSYETNLSDTWQFEINPTQAVGVSLSNKLSEGVNWTISIVPITNESAEGNNDSGITEYDVEVSAEGTNVDLYIKADDDLKTSGGDVLGLGNETYSYNQTNNTVPSDLKFQLTLQYADNQIGDNLPNGTKVYLKFFLSAPASQPAGTYNNTVMVKAVPYGYSP